MIRAYERPLRPSSAPRVFDSGRAAAFARFDPQVLEASTELAALLEGASARKGATRLPLPEGFMLSVPMPAYDEHRWITSVLGRVSTVPIPKEIVVVDDGSTDGTRELVAQLTQNELPELRVFSHDRNRGKGAVVRIAQAADTVCLIQDADLEGDPAEHFQPLEPILDGRADVVYGSRFADAGGPRVSTLSHYLANKVLSSNILTNLRLTDMETCYKVVRTDLLKSLALRANRFCIEPEITVKLPRTRARIYGAPISYNPRDYAQGKKIGWRDGLHAIWALFRFRFFDRAL